MLLLGTLMVCMLSGCGEATKKVKSEGMTITLSKEYKKSTLANATWYYTSPDGLAMGIRSLKDDVEKSGLEVDSVHDYAEAYIKANGLPSSTMLNSGDGYVYFEYSREVSGTMYSYISFVYDNEDEYWIVNFACYKELYKSYRSDFFDSADSVTFSEKE